jgi:hypothetical protein
LAKIFCIVGASCSGKDTIFQRLIDVDKTLVPIITYTTRPIRQKERNGKEYYFVDNKVYHKLKNSDKIIEYRSYKTVHGTWYYFTANDGQIDIKSDKTYIMVNTLEGVQKLQSIYPNNLVVIHICVDERDRLLRCIAREMNGNEDYVEMCRRFVADAKDYSINNFNNIGIPHIRVQNECVQDCVDEIRKIIKSKK